MKTVTIYTSDDCTNCHNIKEFFNDNDVSFTEHNISQDNEAKRFLISKKVLSVPYIIIGDKEFLGFNKDNKPEIYKALYK